jgi:SAM-dependent methyltransferase
MAQRTQALYAILSLPQVYSFYQFVTGARAGHRRVIQEIVRPKPGDRVLEIGCGPGDLFAYMPEGVEYVGFDESEAYIRTARKRFGARATFRCQRVSEATLGKQGEFDVVLAFGILHHLDDGEAEQLFRLAGHALEPGGSLFTLDGCYAPGQPRIARWLLDSDRGKNVRTEDGYVRLARSVFSEIRPVMFHDLLHIPSTAVALECRGQRM